MLEPQLQRGGQMDQTAGYAQSRPRTTSSSFYPPQNPAAAQSHLAYYSQTGSPQSQHSHGYQNHHQTHQSQQAARNSSSSHTYTTSPTMQPPAAYRNSSSFDLRRSTSSKSFGQQPPVSGYVALLRKQKATVWCDRAQFEDPRLAAQQRAAKMRAAAEVSEGVAPFGSISTAGGRTATGITSHGKVTSKITGRHHGKTPMVGYAGENHVGVGGVPMRLSATEVEAESSDDEDVRYPSRGQHSRNGSSGHSSVVSNRRNMPHRTSIGANGAQQQAAAAAVAGGPRRFGPGDTPERAGSLASTVEGPPTPVRDDAASAVSGRAMSAGSGSSVERADNLGELGAPSRLASKSIMHSAIAREKSAAKNADDLRRRGSVDERTSTLTSGRLFIANPD